MSKTHSRIYNESDSAADVAIVGLGPGGLAAALEAASTGKAVVAFTDREEYIRGQRLAIKKDSIGFLEKHTNNSDSEDEKFWQKYNAEKSVQTKDIERFLHRKLIQYPNVQIVQLDKKTTTIKSVGKSDGSNFIELNDGRKYYCNNILAADGARHTFANQMNDDLKSDINYRESAVQERHKYHAVVQLQLKKGEEMGSPVTMQPYEKMKALSQLDWTSSYLPKKYILTNAANTKFYLAGEIPEAIFKEEDAQVRALKLKTWATVAIQERYGVTEEQLEYRQSRNTPAKDRLQCTVFEMKMQENDKQFVALENGVFAQIGDARRTPNYNLGHGMNDAIKGGVAFINAMNPRGFDKNKFTLEMEQMDLIIEDNMTTIKQRNIEAKDRNRSKIINSLDNLITRLEANVSNLSLIETVKNAKIKFTKEDDLAGMYDAINQVQPIAAIHKDTGFLYRIYRAFASLFDSKAALTKTAIILEDVKSNVGAYAQGAKRF
ncbi:MAG: FAD-dependent oxidoreductase [Legionella sp.]|nr:FAD-dependent oxidoreductase [Legionella sp.]